MDEWVHCNLGPSTSTSDPIVEKGVAGGYAIFTDKLGLRNGICKAADQARQGLTVVLIPFQAESPLDLPKIS